MGNELHFRNFTTRLRELRKVKGLTQKGLADAIGVDLKTVRNWENDSLIPLACEGMKAMNILNLCTVLDCDFEYLFGDIPEPQRADADLSKETGLDVAAVRTLRNLTDCERAFLNSLLRERADLYYIAIAYEEFYGKKRLNRAIESGTVAADFDSVALTAKNDLDYTRFTLANRFMLFADKDK